MENPEAFSPGMNFGYQRQAGMPVLLHAAAAMLVSV